MPKLKRLQIELTNRCNERCIHCYIPHEKKECVMDSTLIVKILEQCRDMKLEQIVFSGGEPMLHHDFLDAVDRANWHGFKIRIFSNLTALTDDIIYRLKTYNIQEIQTSLYSVNPAIHDEITKLPGSCNRTKTGIEKLMGKNMPVFIACPITKINKESYPDVLAFAQRFGIGSAPVTMIMAQTGGGIHNLAYRLDIEEAIDVIRSILENDTAYDDERFLPGRINLKETLPCVQNICSDTICVNTYGEVIPLPGWHKVLGNLNHQTLADIWEKSPELRKIREIDLDHFPGCSTCPDIQFCTMNLEVNANENPDGNPLIIPRHVCKLAKATHKLVHSYHNSKEAQ